ncbi:hypothetical protein CYMTET_8561 [Cymbomonas tetramitiformis]|uniref:Uncharacterized protein n=1 Tax=Cymbomonas tetramitiformis TaxID=36881 RepID=A0AAE0GUN2_9CHLO|nr:hypothetical protein CYMTET_8561 [Cymbomonas tetramitiformis]
MTVQERLAAWDLATQVAVLQAKGQREVHSILESQASAQQAFEQRMERLEGLIVSARAETFKCVGDVAELRAKLETEGKARKDLDNALGDERRGRTVLRERMDQTEETVRLLEEKLASETARADENERRVKVLEASSEEYQKRIGDLEGRAGKLQADVACRPTFDMAELNTNRALVPIQEKFLLYTTTDDMNDAKTAIVDLGKKWSVFNDELNERQEANLKRASEVASEAAQEECKSVRQHADISVRELTNRMAVHISETKQRFSDLASRAELEMQEHRTLRNEVEADRQAATDTATSLQLAEDLLRTTHRELKSDQVTHDTRHGQVEARLVACESTAGAVNIALEKAQMLQMDILKQVGQFGLELEKSTGGVQERLGELELALDKTDLKVQNEVEAREVLERRARFLPKD